MNQKIKKKNAMELRKSTAKLFGNKCYVCERKFGKGFSFHHVYYDENEKKYSDFKNSIDYQLYVFPIIQSNPDQFRLLCRTHHHQIEILKCLKIDKFNRLIHLTKISRGMTDI